MGPVGRTLARWPWAARAHRLGWALKVVRPRLAFCVGEVRGGTRRYRVGGTRLVLRHGSRDIDIVNEIWGPSPSYDPPPALERRLRRGDLRVLDVGANIGLFALFAFSRWDVAQLVSWEPDRVNVRILVRAWDLNPQLQERWEIRRRAVANFSGEMRFLSLGSPESHQPDAESPGACVGVEDLLTFPEAVDLLKMDIEGGEWALLEDERLGRLEADVIVMEWHWRGCPHPDAHDAAVAALERAGYQIACDLAGHVPGVGLLWAARPDHLS